MEGFVFPVLLVCAILNGMKIIDIRDEWQSSVEPWHQIWQRKEFYYISAVVGILELILWYGMKVSIYELRLLDLLWTYALLAIIDWKKGIVPDVVIIEFLAGQMLMGGISTAPGKLLSGFITGLVLAALLLALALLMKDKFGMGDAKLLGATAIAAGWSYTVSLIAVSLVVSFLWSICLLLFRHKSIKTEIPFVPCLAAGMIIQCILNSY